MRNRNIKEILFYFSLIFIMVMSLNMAVKDSTGMAVTFGRMLLFTLAATASASLAVLIPASLLAAFLLAIGWAAYVYYKTPDIIIRYINAAMDFFNWLYGYVIGYNYFEEGYSLLFAILYTVLVSLLISFIVYSGKGSFALIVIGVAALSFFWFIYVQKARLYLVLFLFAGIMLYSYQVYKCRLKEWKAADSAVAYNVGRNWMICTAVIVSAATLLSLCLPLNVRPLKWSWLNDKAVSIFPFITDWRNDAMESFSYGYNSRYSFNSAGSSGNRLGGDVLQDTSVMMTVRAAGQETLYLRGAVKDRYSENSWRKSKRSYKEYSSGFQLPLSYGSDVKTYQRDVEITYEKLMTSTVFSPYAVYEVEHKSGRIYADEDMEVYTPKKTMKGEKYTVKSMLPYVDVLKLRQKGTVAMDMNEYKLYTALAQDISPRVKLLSQEITKGKNNNYDKAKAIEQFLRSSFKYTLKPPKLPSGAEFTDHFLFEGKEGYCTYFATSMAVLLRASGVPCRYVEGFIARYEGEEERRIRGTDSHAWVEVYFDDFDWITFEPTPQYPTVELKAAAEAAEEIVPEVIQEPGRENDYMPNLTRRRSDMELEEEAGGGTVQKQSRKSGANYGKILLCAFAALLLVRFCCLYLSWIIKELSIGKDKGRKYALSYIKDVIWYLHRAGFIMKQEETLREFLKRVEYNYSERFSDIGSVTQILEKIRYSNADISFEERKILDVFRKKVKSLALKKSGPLQYFASLYILGR